MPFGMVKKKYTNYKKEGVAEVQEKRVEWIGEESKFPRAEKINHAGLVNVNLTLTLILAKHFFLLRYAHNAAIRILISALLSRADLHRVF